MLIQAGFGDLNLENESDEEDFLSETSVNDSDYQVLLQDDFVDVMSKNLGDHSPQYSSSIKASPNSLTRDLDIQVPKFSPRHCYNQ